MGMKPDPPEDALLRSVALQNATSILVARRRAEDELVAAKDALAAEARTLELINQTGMRLASTLERQELVQVATDAVRELSAARFAAFFYNATNDDGDVLLLYALSGAPRAAFDRFGNPRATALFGPTFRGEGVIRSDDITRDDRYGKSAPHHGMPAGHLPVRSYLAVPVRTRQGDVIGGFFLGHPDAAVFDARCERMTVAIAAQAGIAMDNARLYEAAQRTAAERERLLERERAGRVEVERASMMKDEFLSILSHELRTPLASIIGWAGVLRRRTSDERILAALEPIERNAHVQNQLIDDLLDMSSIRSGKLLLDVRDVDVAGFIDAAVETMRPAAAAKEITLETVHSKEACRVCGDPGRLQQVVWNLVSNAIKFTPRGGKITVGADRSDGRVSITVSDDGQGIEADFLPFVFDRFRQADSTNTRRHGGLGLGLSIVKHLVEQHGGTVQVQSDGPGTGASFIVSLPESTNASDASPSSRENDAGPGGSELHEVHVLVVDDDADARALLRDLLESAGARVVLATSAVEALALMGSDRPDVVVSDIGMPDVDGYELLRRVRALPDSLLSAVPAIALTAFARSEDRLLALRAGFTLHVPKPIRPDELVAAIASVGGRHRKLVR